MNLRAEMSPEAERAALAAIDDAVVMLLERTDPPGDARYVRALGLLCGILVGYTGSREAAVEELRSLATGCQLAALEAVE